MTVIARAANMPQHTPQHAPNAPPTSPNEHPTHSQHAPERHQHASTRPNMPQHMPTHIKRTPTHPNAPPMHHQQHATTHIQCTINTVQRAPDAHPTRPQRAPFFEMTHSWYWREHARNCANHDCKLVQGAMLLKLVLELMYIVNT